jgi:hypothetical protein
LSGDTATPFIKFENQLVDIFAREMLYTTPPSHWVDVALLE